MKVYLNNEFWFIQKQLNRHYFNTIISVVKKCPIDSGPNLKA